MPVRTNDASQVFPLSRVWVKHGAESGVGAHLRGFAARVAMTAGFDVVITDGKRSARDQALRLRSKLDGGGTSALYSLYRADDLVREIVEGGTSVAQMEVTIRSQIRRGLFLSRHMRDDAVDLRTSGYSAAERARLVTACRQHASNVVDEGDHIHCGGVGRSWTALDPVIRGSVLGLGLVGLGFWWFATE